MFVCLFRKEKQVVSRENERGGYERIGKEGRDLQL